MITPKTWQETTGRKGSTKEPGEPVCEAVVLALHFDTILWALHQSRKLQSDTKPDKSNSGDVFSESITSTGDDFGNSTKVLLYLEQAHD